MPQHDWTNDRGWDSVQLVWLAQLLDWIQPRSPQGYRAYLGSVPALTVDVPNGRLDVSVRQWSTAPSSTAPASPTTAGIEPDDEAVATFTLDPQRAVHIDLHGVLIAAIEVISPRNKDRPAASRPTRT
ncbi:MAG TPA: hypothetical protein VGX78_15240 [Pirellulales bacterium]|jgi:hypothetical protein|nr:hypothetical protein [Pirellulales bacterium]